MHLNSTLMHIVKVLTFLEIKEKEIEERDQKVTVKT